jgi:HEAT repeat protein
MRHSLKVSAVLLPVVCLLPAVTAEQSSPTPGSGLQPSGTQSAQASLSPTELAWRLLRGGVQSGKTEERATAVRVLSLARGQAEAAVMARKALLDDKPEVQKAAAIALGNLHARASIPDLKRALLDKEVGVVMAAAHALVQLHDPSGYEVYYAILTGERKSGQGLIAEQLATLKDPKKMAMLGFQEGIGYIPFAGMGYDALKTILQNDSSPVRAAAAKVLATDPDPSSGKALAEKAVHDKSELVRVAALEAIGERGDPALIAKIAPAMTDEKQSVQYTAAAVILRLSAAAGRKQ